MGKLDIQGLIRTTVTIGAIIGGYYYAMGRLDSHVENRDIHKTTAELSEMFVLRREWESNHTALREDVRYLRNRTDAIYERITSEAVQEQFSPFAPCKRGAHDGRKGRIRQSRMGNLFYGVCAGSGQGGKRNAYCFAGKARQYCKDDFHIPQYASERGDTAYDAHNMARLQTRNFKRPDFQRRQEFCIRRGREEVLIWRRLRYTGKAKSRPECL